ncbi:MAG: FliM/FliN family flagellar motor switch protein [Hyphomonadaceae bacterium]|nr:FliM/FliN family flagellar motor switch protein [Hyphomonadaceae bacterium]
MSAPDTRQPPTKGGPLAGGRVRSDNLRPAKVDPERPFPTARGVLSAAEIEALLRPDLPDVPPAPKQTEARSVPDLDARQAGPSLSQPDSERLCARLGLAVHRETGLGIGLNLVDLSSLRFRSAFPAPEAGAAFACFGRSDGEVEAVLALSPAAAIAIVELSCGADPARLREARPRPLTDIDIAVLTRALTAMAAHLPGGELVCLERRQAFCLSLAPPGESACLKLDLKMDGVSAAARLILSEDALKARPLKLGAEPVPLPTKAAPPPRADGLTALLTARIASLSVPVSRLSDLKPGDTLLLGLPADEPIQLLSGGRMGRVAAEGELGRKGNRMAVRVTRRGPALG